MSFLITITVFNDLNANGVRDPGEPGIEGLAVEARRDAITFVSGSTGVDGTATLDVFPLAGTYVVTVELPTGWTFTTAHPQSVVYPGGSGSASVEFGQTEAPARQCVTILSSWVEKVCWVPGRGVQVTFKHSIQGRFCCFYPGTTFADYTRFKAAPSKGQHVAAFYADRPYITVPVGS